MTESMTPADAVEQYLASKRLEASQSTVANHRYRLRTFIEWADEDGFHDLSDLSGRDVERFKNWKVEQGNINKVTLKNHLNADVPLQIVSERTDVSPEVLSRKEANTGLSLFVAPPLSVDECDENTVKDWNKVRRPNQCMRRARVEGRDGHSGLRRSSQRA